MYESDPTKWIALPWIGRYTGKRYRVGSADERDAPEVVRLQTYRDVVGEFRTHPQAKGADGEGEACSRRTVGLLQRRVVRETHVVHVGKEANKLAEVEAGLEHDAEVIYTEYRDPKRDPWRTQVLPMLRQLSQRELAKTAGLSVRRLRDLLTERAQLHEPSHQALTRIAMACMRDQALDAEMPMPSDAIRECSVILER